MKRRARCFLFLSAVIFPSVLVQPAAATGNLLQNGGFATGIEGWFLAGGPGVTMTWDASLGEPLPGSLQLTAQGPIEGAIFAQALSDDCFELQAGERYRLEAEVLLQLEGDPVTCVPLVVAFPEPGCSGEQLLPGNIVPNQPGVWENRISGVVGDSLRSARAGLLMTRTSAFDGTADCNFDSVVFRQVEDVSPLEVPALGRGGLALLSLLLVSAGMLGLRGRLP